MFRDSWEGYVAGAEKGADEAGKEGGDWVWEGLRAHREFGLYFKVMGSQSRF